MAALLLAACSRDLPPAPSGEPPSLVLVLIDTLRADRLGAYGYDADTSPALDALARRGTLFERAYAPSSWTWPSTATLLTGKAPEEHGFSTRGSPALAGELVTLAEALRAHGRPTAAFSANPMVGTSRAFDQGFDEFHEYPRRDASATLGAVRDWLRSHADEPFFLYLHWFDPHGPYEPDATIAAELVPPPPPGYETGRCRELVTRKLKGEPFDADELARATAYISALYDGEVATVDHALGRLLEILSGLGLEHRTVVAVTSDHGEEFLDHGLNGHAKQLFEESVRIPLVLAGPGVPAGRRIAEPARLMDLAPTLLRLCDAQTPELEGADLLSPPTGEAPPLLFSVVPGFVPEDGGERVIPVDELFAVRDGSWHLLWAPAAGGQELVRLFDLAADPGARHDVAARYPQRTAALRAVLEAWTRRFESTLRRADAPPDAETTEMLRQLGYLDE